MIVAVLVYAAPDISKIIDISLFLHSYLASFCYLSQVHNMAATELQVPYTSLEVVEKECNETALEMKESDSNQVKSPNEHLMSESSISNPKSKWLKLRNINWMRGLEIVVLSIVILVVWILFSIPTIIYALPPENRNSKPPKPVLPGNSDPTLCDQLVAYSGEACSNELGQWQQCFSQQANRSTDIYIRSDINPQQAEEMAKTFFGGLSLLSPSSECVSHLRPFLCLYLFGLCDSNNQSLQVTRADCERLRDDVCTQEWALAERYLGRDALPQCSDFPNQEEESCSIYNNNSSTNDSNIMCAESYYLNDDGTCMPLCILWVDPPGVGLDADNIAILIAVATAVLSAIILLVLSLSVQRKFMWLFPTFYLNYASITVAAIALPVLIGFMVNDKKGLFCASSDLLTTLLRESTHYCTITGIIFTYGLAQLVLWITFHAISLCWGIIFPFHFRRMKADKKLKYIHYTTVLVALVLPAIPAFLLLIDGYTIIDTPTTFCSGRSPTYTFYALILPQSGLLAIATSALIIMLWIIMKEFVLKKLVRGKRPRLIGKAQAKILFIVCYYTITAIIALITFVNFEVKSERERRALQEHFICQSAGMQADKDCGESLGERLQKFSVLAAVSTFLVSLIPAVVLVFSVKCECKTKKKVDVSRKSSTFQFYVDFSKD